MAFTRLSARLSAVASIVPDGSSIADIGTDHGYLPIALVSEGHCLRAIAADIAAAPLSIARENIAASGLESKISCVLSNGMERLTPNDADTFVIAGMGGETIAGIIDTWTHSKSSDYTYILQPMSRKEELRKYLFDSGFSITQELLAREGDKIYTVFSAKYTGIPVSYTHFELHFGKSLPKSPHLRAYLEKEHARLKRQYDGILSSCSADAQNETVNELFSVITQIERTLSNGL